MKSSLQNLAKYKTLAIFITLGVLVVAGFQNCTGVFFPNSDFTANGTVNGTLNANVVALSPVTATVAVNATLQITAVNAPSGAAFTLISGAGLVDPVSGLYRAPNQNTVAVIGLQTPDGMVGNQSTITVTGTPEVVSLTPNPASLMVGTALTLSGTGGTSPYILSLRNGGSGTGTFDASTGVFTALSVGQVTIDAVDAVGVAGSAVVTILPTIVVTPSPAMLAVGATLTLSVNGGSPPYTFAVQGGGTGAGTVDPSSGLFTATTAGIVNVVITDSQSHSITTNVTVSAIACATAGENNTATITCPGATTIQQINFASYGTPTGDCSGTPFATSACDAPSSNAVVGNACPTGQASCSVAATNAGFGDPCMNVSKKLSIQVTCY